jgi:hypothetical protein
MKKFLTFLFLLITINTFSQANFFKAHTFCIGFKETKESEIVWSPEKTEVDILIVSSENLKIYSSEIQEYYLVRVLESNDDYVKVMAVDKNGSQCFYTFGFSKSAQTFYFLIEYADYAWMYIVDSKD